MFDALLLVGIFISLLAGQFARIELIDAFANIYVHEIFLLMFIGSSVIRLGLSPLHKIVKKKEFVLLIVLTIVSFIISFGEFTLQQNGLSLLYFLRAALYFMFGIYLVEYLKHSKTNKTFIYCLIYSFSILLIITTAIQYIFYPNFWVLKPFGWDPHMYRASSAYFDVFVAAAIYGVLSFFWYINKKYILSLSYVSALALSFSRSAYLAFLISIIYYFIVKKKWRELLIIIFLFISLVLILPKPFGEGVNLLRTASISSRIQDYQLGVKIWQEKPLLGFGYNRIRFAKEQLNLAQADDKSHSLASFHSSFLVLLVTGGMLGFAIFMFILLKFYKKYPTLRVYGIFILSMSLFDNVLLHALVALPLIFVAIYSIQSKVGD